MTRSIAFEWKCVETMAEMELRFSSLLSALIQPKDQLPAALFESGRRNRGAGHRPASIRCRLYSPGLHGLIFQTLPLERSKPQMRWVHLVPGAFMAESQQAPA